MDNLRMILVAIVCFCPVVIALTIITRERRSRLARRKSPFPELRRRPAGEALRIKISDLDDKLNEYIAVLVLAPVLVATTAWYLHSKPLVSLLPPILFSVIFTTAVSFKMFRRLRERDGYRLGFEGERFVAEELTYLIGIGFEIFHDVPFKNFNVDHVLVGPNGVFAVETKTRRKPYDKDTGKQWRVEFNGSVIRWPWGDDKRSINQAMNCADALSKWLSSAVAQYVPVIPVLTLPGWWVHRAAPPGQINVLNPEEIIKLCRSKPPTLTKELIGQICHQLGEKCKRDFE